jgi:ATP-dependent Clp protease adaptor protein ClpS
MLLRFVPSGSSTMTTSLDKRGAPGTWVFRGVPLRLAGDDGADRGGDGGSKFDTGTATKTRPKTKRPSLYRVLLLNDDYTPMEFVVLVLQDVFNKSREEAMRIMLHVHNQGVGMCGVFPFEVAETKVTRVMDTARKNQHPLQCVMEKE